MISKGTLAQIFNHVNPNTLKKYLMDDFQEQTRQQALLSHHENIETFSTRFTCEREMIRDYDKELLHCDGYSYWRTTGRLLVTWNNGNVTAIETRQVPDTPVVIDCGYDEGLPF